MGFVSAFIEVNQEMLLTAEVAVWIFDRIINEKMCSVETHYAHQYCPERPLVPSLHCHFMVR